jgi:formylglycine-generating enzyme required for sulfatase activity
MYGNVWEWCLDNWHDNYDGAPNDGSGWIEGEENTLRILRNGCWAWFSGNDHAALS